MKANDLLLRLERNEEVDLADVLPMKFPRKTPTEQLMPLVFFLEKHGYTLGLDVGCKTSPFEVVEI